MTTLYSLTETRVESAKPPPKGEIFFRDKSIRGFALRVNWGRTEILHRRRPASMAASAVSLSANTRSCPSPERGRRR